MLTEEHFRAVKQMRHSSEASGRDRVDVRTAVLKAVSEAIDKVQGDLDRLHRLHRKGWSSYNPPFDVPSILDAAEEAFAQCGFPSE